MSTTKKVLRTVVVLGLIGAFAAVGAFSAFSSQTENPSNQITAGTVDLADNDSGTALYNLTNAKPSDPQQRCIEVSYTGSLAVRGEDVPRPGRRARRARRQRDRDGPDRHAGHAELPRLHRLQRRGHALQRAS